MSHDAETVTVTMASGDADFPRSAFVYDGKGPVREERLPQEPSGAPPAMGAEAWVGRYPFDLFTSSDWRGPLVALMGAEGYAAAQAGMATASPMAVDGDWVAGSGFEPNSGQQTAVALSRVDGRLLVAVRAPDGSPRMWGDARGPLPAEIAATLAPR